MMRGSGAPGTSGSSTGTPAWNQPALSASFAGSHSEKNGRSLMIFSGRSNGHVVANDLDPLDRGVRPHTRFVAREADQRPAFPGHRGLDQLAHGTALIERGPVLVDVPREPVGGRGSADPGAGDDYIVTGHR